jgi:hypothetical protein
MGPRVQTNSAVCLILLFHAIGAGACTEATLLEDGEGSDIGSSLDATPIDASPPYDIGLLTVDTGLSDDAPQAGETIEVFCTVEGLPDHVAPPLTSWKLLKTPEGSELPTIEGSKLTFTTAGEYAVQCAITETGYHDPTPAKIVVWAGNSDAIETTVEPMTIMAGNTADVTCQGDDSWGNPVSEWEVMVTGDPQGGLISSGLILKGLTVGTYSVACAQVDGEIDPSPVSVNVEHGLPKRIKTLLEETFIPAGDSTGVTCTAEDKYGNNVPDLPMTVALPAQLSMVGFDVTGVNAGTYAVTCVPAGLDWSAFNLEKDVLEVQPGEPVSLTLDVMPPKPYFGTYEKVTLTPMAHDAYGNLVIEPDLLPVWIDPDQNFIKKSELAFAFKEEGYYTLTTALTNAPDEVASVDVAIEGEPPSLVVTYPDRAETIQGSKPSVTVEGVALDTIAGVEKVLVNGVEANLEADGSFTKIIIPQWGLNILKVEAIDSSDAVTTVIQSFVFAEDYYAMEPDLPRVPDALQLWLSKEFIDDGVHNPTHINDIATVIEVTLANLDLSKALKDSDVGGGYKVVFSDLNFNPPKVTLSPIVGGLNLKAKIKNLSVGLKLQGECKVLGIDLCPDFSGSVSVEEILIDSDMMISAEQGNLQTGLDQVDVSVGYVDLEVDGILGWLFDWLIDFIVNIFTNDLEELFKSELEDELSDQIVDILDELAITETFEIDGLLPGMPPMSLTFDTNIYSAKFDQHGGRIGLGGRFLTSKKVAWDIHGSIARGTCLKGFPVNWQLPGEENFEVGLFDDFLNLAMTSVWYAGALDLSLDKDTLGGGDGFDLGGLPVDDLNLDIQFLLPPIINGCESDTLLYLQMGDLFLDAELFSPLFEGGIGKIGTYVSMELSAEIFTTETEDGTAISLVINGLESIHFHWEYVPVEFEGSEDILEDLIKSALIDTMLENLTGESLLDFVIPPFDLGSDGVTIVPVIEDLTRGEGHTLVQGYLD